MTASDFKKTSKGETITVRLSQHHEDRIQAIQQEFQISRNKVVDMLLDAGLSDFDSQVQV